MVTARSASAGQHALLHGLLRFQIELRRVASSDLRWSCAVLKQVFVGHAYDIQHTYTGDRKALRQRGESRTVSRGSRQIAPRRNGQTTSGRLKIATS
jgi:hypothetical protein